MHATVRRWALVFALLGSCGGGEETPPATVPLAGNPPASTPTPPETPPGTPGVPPGMVTVTVSAASTPPGATVTGGGANLGTTPFVTSVPVPAPTPGVTQTFEFTFQYPGYNATTVTASPVNSTINLNVVLSPLAPTVAVTPPGTVPGVPGVPGVPVTAIPPGTRFVIHGVGGGAITDYHTTTATADVTANCRIRSLSADLSGSHSFNSDLEVRLRAPDGETFSLQNHNRRNPFRSHTVRRAAGHMSGGTWILQVEDSVGADSGRLTGFDLTIVCG